MYAKKAVIPGAPRVSPERKRWVKKESATIIAKNMVARDKTKEKMFEEREKRDHVISTTREKRLSKWLTKTKNSPFAIDLVAEDERIYEENQIRMREDQARREHVEARRSKAKNDIILKVK